MHKNNDKCIENTTKKLKSMFGEDTKIIDSYTPYTDDTINDISEHIKLLSKAINKLSDVDGIYFTKGWENSRGCKVEHYVSLVYDLDRFYEE